MLCCNSKYTMYSENPSFQDYEIIGAFFSFIIRSGNRSVSYFANGGLENLEQLHPSVTDCAGYARTTSPHF